LVSPVVESRTDEAWFSPIAIKAPSGDTAKTAGAPEPSESFHEEARLDAQIATLPSRRADDDVAWHLA